MRCEKPSVVAVVLVLFVSIGAQAGVTIDMHASPAVNRFFSPTWTAWTDNAKTALKDGLSSVGNPATDPDAYYTVPEFVTTDIAVTTFESWKGTAPGGAPFDQEHGQRVHFPMLIASDTGQDDIRLANAGNLGLYYLDTDESPTEVDVFGLPPTWIFSNYDAHVIGVKADGTIIDSGSNTQLVNKIIYVSLGMAWADDEVVDPPGATNQDTLDMLLAELGDGSIKHLRATIGYYNDAKDTLIVGDEIQVEWVPEPTALTLVGLGAIGSLRLRRRQR